MCFQLSETREYTAKELAHAEFLSVDTQVSSFIVNGYVVDPQTNLIEIMMDKKFKAGQSTLGALESSNVLLISPSRVEELNVDSHGLKLLHCKYRDEISEKEVSVSSLGREFYVISSEIELPCSKVVFFNPDKGDRDYDPTTRRIGYAGFPLKLIYDDSLKDRFTGDMMVTREIFGQPHKHSRRLVISQRMFQRIKAMKPRGLEFGPVFFE